MYKKYYRLFLEANKHIQHYASHSHHYWPDVTRQAMLEYWDDSARYVDDKWSYFFENKIPETQQSIARILNLTRPSQIAFAPNTHEFIYRLLSCFEPTKKISVLSTDSEFYSFDRQINRLSEAQSVNVHKVSTLPFDNFEERFIQEIQNNSYDVIFLSHVFFNSGMVVKNLKKIIDAVTSPETMIIIDGYHGFMALPTDLREIEDRIFYLAGSYKYAQGGEGCCFLHVPKNSPWRPLYTGWFAGFSALSEDAGKTTYSNDGMRFAGSTMDFSALYRLQAALTLFEQEKISVKMIHSHIQKLQDNFRDHLLTIDHHFLCEKNILSVDYKYHGHFLTFAMPSSAHAKKMHDDLRIQNIWTDYRDSRLRFGFGLYQNDCIDLSSLKR
ncbi:MAG: aminotransferase class V-fold PLP-dependent enzyme [Bacteriovorax sp.]|jgi:selenocysteine lyase/cysteine desulfurase|nr:aminotransferase class V-fold PLP-dependent enzyme [Bacteriovorax sp.]